MGRDDTFTFSGAASGTSSGAASGTSSGAASGVPAFDLYRPARQTLPLVISSPHSGRYYPATFVDAAQLDPLTLRQSEDSFVDSLLADAPALGAPLLAARFPRAYLDLNREPWELDPSMFSDPLPSHANTRSSRVAGGLGTIARVISGNRRIYRHLLPFAEAERRIREIYTPFHDALSRCLEETRSLFGYAILLDCHSMPSASTARNGAVAGREPQVILGNCHGASASNLVTGRLERLLQDMGYRVTRNVPYAGGFITGHYGRPEQRWHTVQIEISRALYMDEKRMEPTSGYAALRRNMRALVRGAGGMDSAMADSLRPAPRAAAQ